MRVIVVLTLLVTGSVSFAEGKNMISRGGLGFLFVDHNSFNNPGQLALDKGTSFEGQYLMTSSTPSAVAATTSFVYSSGRFALGAFGVRGGLSLTDAGQYADIVGGGIGFAIVKDKVTLGVGGRRQISTGATTDGTVGATLTFNGSKKQGFSLGIGADTELNSATTAEKTATVGLGYAFKSNASIEANYTMNSFDNTADYTAAGFLNLGSKMVYFSAGGNYAALTASSSVLGRLGFVLGKVDFSGTVTYPMATGSNPTFGGTARLTF